MLKKFLRWLLQPPYEPPKSYKSTAKGTVIRCHDCGKYGHFAVDWEYWFDYEIPDDWKIVWVGLKPLFICKECQEKRRKWARENLKMKDQW